ncbi:hypothetical protein [Azospirillum palustre]
MAKPWPLGHTPRRFYPGPSRRQGCPRPRAFGSTRGIGACL